MAAHPSSIARAAAVLLAGAVVAGAAPVAVQHAEGLVHGFLTLRALDGKLVANGDLIQNARGDRVTSRLVFRFTDGSVRDETAVFSQRGEFRLISDRLVQKGPTFERPLEMSIDCAAGQVVVRYQNEDGQSQVADERMELPADLANGMVLTLLKNVRPGDLPLTLSMIAATPQPRLVKLVVTAVGQERFLAGSAARTATHYAAKIEIGGVAGVVAPLVGKQPPDLHVWVLGGAAPAFVKFEGPLSLGAPPWRIELASPRWPSQSDD